VASVHVPDAARDAGGRRQVSIELDVVAPLELSKN
jgi:hypothetical protein